MSNIIKKHEIVNTSLSQEQVDLIKRTICKGATDDELQLFIGQCNRTRLDPMSGQIHAIKRWNSKEGREVMQIQVSIDGLRIIASRTGEYEGQTHPLWCGKDGIWKEVWLDSEPPVAAKVGIYRKGFREPCFGIAKFDSYKQTHKSGNSFSLMPIWLKMPEAQICKCAEALGLRKAFPNDMSGLYIEDESAYETNQVPFESVRSEKTTEIVDGQRKVTMVKEAEIIPKQETVNEPKKDQSFSYRDHLTDVLWTAGIPDEFVLGLAVKGKLITEKITKLEDVPEDVIKRLADEKYVTRILSLWNKQSKSEAVEK